MLKYIYIYFFLFSSQQFWTWFVYCGAAESLSLCIFGTDSFPVYHKMALHWIIVCSLSWTAHTSAWNYRLNFFKVVLWKYAHGLFRFRHKFILLNCKVYCFGSLISIFSLIPIPSWFILMQLFEFFCAVLLQSTEAFR